MHDGVGVKFASTWMMGFQIFCIMKVETTDQFHTDTNYSYILIKPSVLMLVLDTHLEVQLTRRLSYKILIWAINDIQTLNQKCNPPICNPRFRYRNCGSSSTAGKRLSKLKDEDLSLIKRRSFGITMKQLGTSKSFMSFCRHTLLIQVLTVWATDYDTYYCKDHNYLSILVNTKHRISLSSFEQLASINLVLVLKMDELAEKKQYYYYYP